MFPLAHLELSQWTVTTLFERFFVDDATSAITSTAELTLREWQNQFSVAYREPCHKRDFASTVELQGSVTTPVATLDASPPQVAILPGGRLGMSGRFSGTTRAVAEAWFIEGVCFSTECECTGLPVQRLCTSSTIAMNFTVTYAVEVDLAAGPAGNLPLEVAVVGAMAPAVYINECPAMDPGANLPFFARQFNATFMDATQQNFTALQPMLTGAVQSALVEFVATQLQPAMNKYFPARVDVVGDLTARFAVTDVSTRSSARIDLVSGSTVDAAACLAWNASAAFAVAAVDGGAPSDFPPDPTVSSDARTFMPSDGGLNTTALATRLSVSSQLLDVAAWYATARDALTRTVRNTILDATIDARVNLDVPLASTESALPNLPSVSSFLNNDLVQQTLDAQLPRVEAGHSGEPTIVHALRLTIASGEASITCRNGSLLLLQADMGNITTRTDPVLQMDAAADILVGGPRGALLPSTVPSLFLWTTDFNHFEGSRFHVVKPTGGFPATTLTSMLEKALTESLPDINEAYRKHRVPLPPAVALALRPESAEAAENLPSVAQLISVRVGGSCAAPPCAASRLELATRIPSAPSPPAPPAPLVSPVPLRVTLTRRPSCAAQSAAPTTRNASTTSVQGVSFTAVLSAACSPIGVVNATTRWYGRVVRAAALPSTDARSTTAATRFVPQVVDLLCRDAECIDCLLPAAYITVSPISTSEEKVADACLSFPGASWIAPGTITLAAVADQTAPSLCRGGAPLVVGPSGTQEFTLVENSPDCGDGLSAVVNAPTAFVTFALPLDAAHDMSTTTSTCAPMPSRRIFDPSGSEAPPLRTAVVVRNRGSSLLYLMCTGCPSSPADILRMCGDDELTVNMSTSPSRAASGAFGWCTNGTALMLSGASQLNIWAGWTADLAACNDVVFDLPVPPVKPFDVALWVPVIVIALVSLLLAAGLALRRWRRQRRERLNSVNLTGKELLAGDVEDEHQPAELQSPGGWPFAAATVAIVALACAISAVVFVCAPPFSNFSSQHAHSRGLPHSFDLATLRGSLDVWETAMTATLAATAGVLALLLLLAAVLWITTARLRERDAKARWTRRLHVACEAAVQHGPAVTVAVVTLLTIALQFAVLAPPLQVDGQRAASVSFNASARSIISAEKIDRYGSDVAGIATTLLLLPSVLHFVCAFSTAIPVAAGIGMCVRSLVAIYRQVRGAPGHGHLTLLDVLKRVWSRANADIEWSRTTALAETDGLLVARSNYHRQVGVNASITSGLPPPRTCATAPAVEPAGDRSINLWPRGTRRLDSAIPAAWSMVQTLACVSVFCMNVVSVFIAFESSREVAWLTLAVLRTVLGLVPIWTASQFRRASVETAASALDGEPAAGRSEANDFLTPAACRNLRVSVCASAAFLFADLVLSGVMAGVTSVLPGGAPMCLHVTVIALGSWFFLNLDFRSTVPRAVIVETAEEDVERRSQMCCVSCVDTLTVHASALERFSVPWWRLPFLFVATVFVILAFQANVANVQQDSLRSELIGYLSDNGIQFPRNISDIHLFVDPGIDAYQAALRVDLTPMGIGLGVTVVAFVAAIARPCVAPHSRAARWLPRVSRIAAVCSYVLLLVTALYFTLPDFVQDSKLGDVVPDCAPEFFREGELLLHTLARAFFSSVVFGRLAPLLVTLPPALVRVQCFVAEQCGVTAHVLPMLVATLVSNLAVQLPLLTITVAAHSSAVVGLAASLPVALLAVVPLFRFDGSSFTSPRLAKLPRIVWLFATLAAWWLVYFGGWVLIVWQAIEFDERLWNAAKRLFASAALWYEIFANFFLATVAFCDVIWLTTDGLDNLHDDAITAVDGRGTTDDHAADQRGKASPAEVKESTTDSSASTNVDGDGEDDRRRRDQDPHSSDDNSAPAVVN